MAPAPVFISYARADDEAFVARLRADLEAAGIPVWWDRVSMESRGRRFLHELQDAIEGCERLIAVIGPAALKSPYVRAEWEHALLFARAVTPVLRLGSHEDFARAATVGESFGLTEDLSQLHAPNFGPARDYHQALAELVRVIRTPAGELGELHGVPPLPPHFVPRRQPLQALADSVLRDLNAPVVVTAARQASALHGMGGIGKSVLAAAFGRSARVRRAFPGGVFWLPMSADDGEQAVLAPLRRLGAALGDDLATYTDSQRAIDRLTRLLARRRCLLIADDLWQLAPAEALRRVAGPSVRLLVTTRVASLAVDLGAQAQELDLLADAQAVELLGGWMQVAPSDLPASARALVHACGRLPLALAMVGAMLHHHPDRIDAVFDSLRRADLRRLQRRLPDYPHPDLMRALAVSIDALDPRARRAYAGLVVFRPRVPIPEQALACLWALDGLDEADAQQTVDRLIDRSLVRRTGRGQVQLHDLQHAYLVGLCTDAQALHRRLVEAYRGRCGGCWTDGPDDGYFFQQLPYHLAQAGARDELRRLLSDLDWLQAKLDALRRSSPPLPAVELARDFDLVAAPDAQLSTLRRAVVQSLHALDEGSPVAAQLLARLAPKGDAGLESLLAAARRWRGPAWLEPVTPSLRQPDPLQRIYKAMPEAVTEIELLEPEDQVVCASLDMYDNIAVVDLATGAVLRTLSDPAVRYADTWDGEAGIVALALSADRRWLLTRAEHEHGVKVWDFAAGTVRGLLDCRAAVDAIVTPARPDRALSIAANRLQLWDLESLRCIVEIEGLPSTRRSGAHVIANELSAVAVDEQAEFAVAGDHEGQLLLFDLQAGQLLKHVPAHAGWVKAVAIDRASGLVLTGSWGRDATGIRLWRLFDLAPQGELPDPGASIRHIRVANHTIVAAGDEHLTVWNLHTREAVARHDRQGGRITDLAMSADGRAVAGYLDGTVKVWSTAESARAGAGRGHRHRSAIDHVVVNPEGTLVASSARDEPDILLWDTETGEPCGRLLEHAKGRIALAMLADGRTLVSAGSDGLIVGFDLASQRPIWCRETGLRDFTSVAALATEAGERVVTGDWNGRVVVWDPHSGLPVTELPRREADASWRSHPGAVRAVATRPGELWVGTENAVERWDLATLQRIGNHAASYGFDHDDHYVVGLCLLPDGRTVSACTDGCVQVLAPGVEPRRLYPDQATSVATTAAGDLLVLATRAKAVSVVDVAAGFRRVCDFSADSDMLACGCSADGSLVAAGDEAGNVHLLRLRRRAGFVQTR